MAADAGHRPNLLNATGQRSPCLPRHADRAGPCGPARDGRRCETGGYGSSVAAMLDSCRYWIAALAGAERVRLPGLTAPSPRSPARNGSGAARR